jgi:hypothetical protein
MKIISTTLPSIVFEIFTIIFTLQQNNFARMNREQDQRQADEENNRIIFQHFYCVKIIIEVIQNIYFKFELKL